MIARTPVSGDVLVDAHGRRMRKLRVSITEACNLRCRYCMPVHAAFAGAGELLPATEVVSSCRSLVELGVDQIRLTGGEPTLRPDFAEIVRGIGRLPVESLGLTTNGLLLERYAPLLADAGFQGANVSLDSLDAERFREIARGGSLAGVLSGIEAARKAGLRVKINVVVMRGWNLDELPAFHDFAVEQGLEVRFLELMKIGEALPFFRERFVPASEMLRLLETRSPLREVPVASDSTSFVRVSEAGARLGFIASESRPFCSGCSRLRLSAKGVLRACLMKEDGISVRGVSPADLPDLVRTVVAMKPMDRIAELPQAMHAIGG